MPSSSDLSQKKIKGAMSATPSGRTGLLACREVELAESIAWDERGRSLADRKLQVARERRGDHTTRVSRRAFHTYVTIHSLTRVRQNTVLYASMYVHALKHTDIRVVHRSLFERKDCLGIYWGTYVPLRRASRTGLIHES